MKSASGILPLLTAILLGASTPALSAAGNTPDYQTLRSATLAHSIHVENLTIRREGASLHFKNGTLFFIGKIGEQTPIAVFRGSGVFSFEPPSARERAYWVQRLQVEKIEEPFAEALIAVTDATVLEELRGKATAQPPPDDAALALKRFRERLRKRVEIPSSMLDALIRGDSVENLEAEILTDLLSPANGGLFSVYMTGRNYKDLRFHIRPRGALPYLPSPEEVALINFAPDAGNGGIWYMGHLESERAKQGGTSLEDHSAIDIEHYEIDTTIRANARIEATAKIRFKARTAGTRVVRLDLLPSLRVSEANVGAKRATVIQEDRKEDGSLYLVLPEELAAGAQSSLTIRYAGDKVIRGEGGGSYSVGARDSWYPSAGTFNDRATYDLTFRTQKKAAILGVGRLQREWKDGELYCSQWTSETPIAVAGFNFGQFKRQDGKDDSIPVKVEAYSIPDLPDNIRPYARDLGVSTTKMSESALREAETAVKLYTHYFGPMPFERLALSQQPEFSFGQSWPTLIYLPLAAYLDSTQRWRLFGEIDKDLTNFVDEVTVHEVSHQWWGHLMTWASYRDQWLSEGFAVFSAGLYAQHANRDQDHFRKYWQSQADAVTKPRSTAGPAYESGPVTLGLRLSTPMQDDSYFRVVYSKGGFILHMLRQLMWDRTTKDERFIAMMKDFVETHRGKAASTESFKAIAERHITKELNLEGNGRLDWFFRQWVMGTEIPHFDFDYSVTPGATGEFLLSGTLRQKGVSEDFRSLVPLYIEANGGTHRIGAIRVTGTSTPAQVKVTLPLKPKSVMVNAWHDVLSR